MIHSYITHKAKNRVLRNDLLTNNSNLAYPTAQSEVGGVGESPFPENEHP
jgi:hypothetical protein